MVKKPSTQQEEPHEPENLISGQIKFFIKEKKWGFITCSEGKDYFLHISTLRKAGLVSFPPKGTKVVFAPKRTKDLKTQKDKLTVDYIHSINFS